MTTVYGDLVRYRELFGNLFRRDVQAKYRGSILGLAWTLANPVLLSVVATHLISFAVMLVVLLALNFALLPRVRGTEWLAVPLAVAVVAITGGLALAIASLNVLFRDVEFLVAALLLPLFFLTPLPYSLSDPQISRRYWV